MGKKIVVPRLDVKKYTVKFSFCPKSAHPIIILKSCKFNMDAVSVKSSIQSSSARHDV